MQDVLIMNKLPLPQYYDGKQWNTVLKPRRSSIPKYLHSQLPELKHLYIKKLFHQIGKFNCPALQYFNNLIKMPTKNQKKKKIDKQKLKAQQLKEQLQYALIISDRQSNIVESLIQKAKTTPITIQKKARSATKQISSGERYFDNTVDLVFNNRKKILLAKKPQIQNPKQKQFYKRISKIPLLKFDKPQ